MPKTSDHPRGVVCVLEGEKRLAQFLDGVEGLHPHEVLLQRSDEALGTAVALGSPHEGRRTFGAQEGDLVLEQPRAAYGASPAAAPSMRTVSPALIWQRTLSAS